MELLDDLLGLLEGIVDDKETLQGIIDSEGLEVLYDQIDPDAFPTMEGYLSYFGELQKKKEETGDTPVISPEENTESNTQTPQVEGTGSSDSSPTTVDVPQVDVPQVDVPQVDVEETNINVTPNIEQEELPGILDPTSNAKKLYEIVDNEIVILGEDGVPKDDKEDETWLEESWLGQAMDWAFDDVPILGVLSADFWGDMYRAIGNGYTKGQSVDDSIALFAKGKNISDQDLAEYIAAVKKSENVTVSDEMKNFQKIYDQNGGGILGFILGFGSNLSIAPELLIDSLSSMINPASAAAGAAGGATGAATGAALTAVSGPGALFGAGAGAVGGAMGGASAALEFGMSYTEFMKEEIEAKGGKFDAEGIRMVLNDDEALQRIRNRAATRGLAIGMIDAMTAGVAGKAIGGTGKALAKATAKKLAAGGKGTVTKAMVNKGIEISAGLGVEIAGGSLGEATARALAGQEMDVAEIGLEGFAGAGNAPISLARGIYTTPRYNLNGDLVTKDYMLATIGTATPDQIAGMNIEIKNDKKMQSVITDLKATSQFDADLQALGVPPGPERDAIVKLELEKSKLPDARSEATRQRRNQIDQQINFLIGESSTITETVEISRDGNTFTEVLSVSKAEARSKLKEEGIESATDGQVSDMQKAMMEQLKNSDTQAEKAIIADQKIADDLKKEVEQSITDQEVQDKINKDTYTDKEFDNAKQSLIKEKVDAIQKSSTTQVDVQESSRDGEGVGEVNVQEEITEESPAKNEQESSESTSQEEAEVDKQSRLDSAPKIFGKSHTDKKLPYGSAVISDITSPDSKGVQTATYNNPQSGELDVVISSTGDSSNFVGFVRVYENGNPTNQFTAKMESTGGAFKNMITEAENSLPPGSEVIETTTISEGGLKTYNKSKTLTEKVDADGNVVTKTTKYSDATKQSVEEKGNEEAFKAFRTDDKSKAEAEVDKIKKAYPGIEVKIKRQGSKRGKKTYSIDLELPVLVKTESKPKSFETIPPSQRKGGTQRFRVPGSRTVDVEVDAEGKAYAVNRKTGRPLKETPPKAQEFILKNVIDVNDGTPLQLDESTNLTPEQYVSEIADNSNNIKEVAETIDLERKRSKELSESERKDLADPLGISSLKGQITEQQFIDANDANNITPNMRRFWFKKKQKNMFGKETGQDLDTRGLDDLVMELDGYTQENESEYIQKVVEFIIQNDTGKVKTQTGKSPGLVDLEIKFEKLTGLKPTKRNIEAVVSIDPNREPNTLTDKKNKEENRKAASEPGVFTKGKRGINPKRITQGKKKKSTLVIDADGLVTQIKLESKAAKESEASYRAAQQRVLDQIKDLQVRGVVRAKQALVMTRKVLRTNFSKEAQVKNLSKYVTDVMNSATINDQIARIQKKTKRKKGGVLYNIKKGKVGADNNALIDVLKILAKAEISSIPLDKLDSFEALVDIYGASKKTLDIQNVGADTKAALDIINSLDAEADADVKVEKVKKEKEAKEYNLDEAVSEIKEIKANTDLISNKDSKKIAEELNLITDQDIKELVSENKDGTFDYSMVESLRSVMQNLSQGIVTPEANNILLEVKSNKAAKIVTKPFSKITLSGIKRNFKNLSSSIKLAITSKSPSGKNIILDKVRSNVASYIDDAFGNLNSTVIFDNTFGLLAQAYESFKVNTDQGFSKIEAAEKVLEFDGKGIVRRTARFGNSANKIVAKKYKIRLLQLAREHNLNLDKNGKPNKKAPSAKEMIDATIEFYNKPENKNVYKNDLKILEQLVDEFTVDGEISLDKLESSLTKGEKKALSIYDEVNNSLAEKGLFTSSVIRSNRIDLLNGYSHRVVLSNETSAAIDEKAVEFSKASTKSGTFEGRTDGPKPISFDPSLSAQRGLQETNIDYFMTSKIREVMKTINKVSKNMKAEGTDAQIQAADALKKSAEEVIKITYGETMRPVGVGEMFLNRIKRNAYQAILAGVPRMGIELASNFSFVMANPKAALLGFKKFAGLSYLGGKKGADILNNLGSTETTKQYNAKTFTSRFADMSNFAQSSPDSMRAKSAFMNVLGILGRLGPKQTISAIDQIAGAIISTPDRAMTRPMWYGTFALRFEAETGIKLSKKDFIEIGEGTSKYLSDEYSDAVKKSTKEADRMGVKISSSQNPFKGVIKNMRRNDPNQPVLLNTYRAVNKFMATFSLFEYGTTRNALGALQRSGDMSKKQAVGIMAAATVRMTMYPLLLSLVANGFDELFTDAEYEEDDSSIEDMITRQTIGTVLTLLTRRSMGNIPNLLPSFGVEKFNEYMLGDFREGEYDPFKHSITFSQFNEGDLKKKGLIETAIGIVAGPMGPIIKTLQRSTDLAVRSITNKTEESREKNKKELTNRMALEVMGNLGLIPFYKDVRRVVMKEMFEDDVVKRRKSKKAKERKQYLDFLKINDPNEYRYELRQDKLKEADKISSGVIDGGDVIKQ